ncbi:uncharacterized protein M6B38_319315 [Iris pallida]|uniref:Serine aminopeptidase S33 domain-containing protein n=1 Tax=Iris pallida TaxID=29817 RepID=A0AAX6HDU8_IRIPA|nr:uncharacterized protein M6B38_319315 [Iris pallida]
MEHLVNFIIRPPRADYSPQNDLLDQEFMLNGRWFQRKDLEVINGRGNVLQCSHYMPLVIPEGKTLPCVIYCHGNSGCRADASEAAIILLPSNITLFTLDFSGSGLSEGEHVTLGWYEKDDLRAVVNHLRADGNVSCIGLWGRSMGAVTSLMYGAEDPSIAGMVLDSPFSNLVDLMMELVDTYRYPLPKFTVKIAIQHMRKVIKKKANFDIMDLDIIQVAKCCFVPVLLGHAADDDFIRPHHSDRIFDSCVGDKNIIKFDGDHNSPRPQFYFDSISIFFQNVLNPPEYLSDEQYFHRMHDLFDKDNSIYRIVGLPCMECRIEIIILVDHLQAKLANGSTEDAIMELRSRKPMSRTEVPPDISSLEKQGSEENGPDGPSSSLSRASLPNGHDRNQLIPMTIDDEYVEYSFCNFSDMPSSTEDEERMVMEAVIQSLKDFEMRPPQEDSQPNAATAPNDLQSDGVQSTAPNDSQSDGVQVSPAGLPVVSLDATGSTNPASFATKSTPVQQHETIITCTTAEPSIKKPTSSSSSSESTRSEDSVSSTTQQDAEMADGTQATSVVQKNPSSHLVEGFARRWRRNFFKNRMR